MSVVKSDNTIFFSLKSNITPVLGEEILSLNRKLISLHNNGADDKHAHRFADF
jgi:hypothetical protein